MVVYFEVSLFYLILYFGLAFYMAAVFISFLAAIHFILRAVGTGIYIRDVITDIFFAWKTYLLLFVQNVRFAKRLLLYSCTGTNIGYKYSYMGATRVEENFFAINLVTFFSLSLFAFCGAWPRGSNAEKEGGGGGRIYHKEGSLAFFIKRDFWWFVRIFFFFRVSFSNELSELEKGGIILYDNSAVSFAVGFEIFSY